MSKKDLDFKDAFSKATNPAMAYISVMDPEENRVKADTLAKSIEEHKQKNERKTKRVQILLKPSTYAKAKGAAQAQGISFNEFMEVLIEKNIGEDNNGR